MKKTAFLLIALACTTALALDPGAAFFDGTNSLAPYDGLSGLLFGANGYRVKGDTAEARLGSAIAAAGDVNGDGKADVLVGAPFHTVGTQVAQGRAYVLLSAPSSGDISINLLTSLVVTGVSAFDQAGTSVAGGGDFNGDGLDDIAVGAPLYDVGASTNAGAVALIFGRTNLPSTLAISALDGTNGMLITGETTNWQTGATLSFAGDANGDGFDDLLVGAPAASPPGTASVGRAYLLFGSTSRVASLSLASLNGTNGLSLRGDDAGDLTGSSVAGLGDFNGDGLADLAVGASAAGGLFEGRIYVVHGRTNWPSQLPLAGLDGTSGFRMNGAGFFSGFGRNAAGADVNGDGLRDLIAGIDSADRCIVLYGRSTSDATIGLDRIDGTNGFAWSTAGGGQFASAVARAGRVNVDAFEDIVVAAPGQPTNGQIAAGNVYVLFGKPSFAATTTVESVIDGTNGFVLAGQQAGAEAGFAVAGGHDLDGDGYDDLLIGERDFDESSATNAGAAYVLHSLGIADLVLLHPEFTGIAWDAGTNRVTWLGQAGVVYDVQTNADLTGPWGTAETVASGGATTVWERASGAMIEHIRVIPRQTGD